MTPSDVYTCPITGCPWQHHGKPLDLAPGITDGDLKALGQAYTADIEQAMTAHFTDDHTIVEWVNEVSRLRNTLAERPPLLCFGCYVDRHNATKAGRPLPPQGHVQLIVNGDGRCLNHVVLQDGPVVPGRTPGGLIVGGNGQVPPPVG